MDRPPTVAAARFRLSRLTTAGWALAVGGLLLATQGTAMAKMVLFSAVSGKVLQDGKAVVGAQVEREFRGSWKSETGTDSTQTDAHGAFRLPAIKRSSMLGSLLPHEPMVRQTILIRHGGKTHKAWMFDKGNDKPDGEPGKPIVMTCRLEQQPTHHGDVFGICELD